MSTILELPNGVLPHHAGVFVVDFADDCCLGRYLYLTQCFEGCFSLVLWDSSDELAFRFRC